MLVEDGDEMVKSNSPSGRKREVVKLPKGVIVASDHWG